MIHNAIQTRATELSQQFRGSAVSLHAFSFFTGQSLGLTSDARSRWQMTTKDDNARL